MGRISAIARFLRARITVSPFSTALRYSARRALASAIFTVIIDPILDHLVGHVNDLPFRRPPQPTRLANRRYAISYFHEMLCS